MNKIILASIFAAVAMFGACAGSTSRSAESPAANSSNSNVSFGIYDIAASRPGSVFQESVTDQSLEKQTALTTVGGGGGGGRNEAQPISQDKISLNQASASQIDPVALERKIVRNGELHVECEQPEEAQKRIALIAQANGGFVVESQQSTSDVKLNTRDIVQLMVRVPADKFAETVDQIKAASGRIIQETIKGEDVTEEFIDIDARLKAKKALDNNLSR
jgi:hypothetical protein